MSLIPFLPPFSYEVLPGIINKSNVVYRIRDSKDNAVARTYVEGNALMIVSCLNAFGVAEPVWKDLAETRELAMKQAEELKASVRELFEILDCKESSDEGTIFSPTCITSCRVSHQIKLAALLPKLKDLSKCNLEPIP